MKKYIGFEIEIPDRIMKTETEDSYIQDLVQKLKSCDHRFLYHFADLGKEYGTKAVKDTFTGEWNFIDPIG